MGYLNFTFDGIKSIDMGVLSVREEEPVMTFPFIGDGDLEEAKAMGRFSTDLFRVNRDNLTIQLALILMDQNSEPKIWTPKDVYRIANWLNQDTYKPLVLGEDNGIVYYAILKESGGLEHYANGGLLHVEFQTNSPYGWASPAIERFDLTDNISTEIKIINRSNVVKYYSPLLEIYAPNGGNVTIENKTLGDDPIVFNGLYKGETIKMNNDREIINSDDRTAKMTDRYNWKWLRLRRGSNTISVTGSCELLFKHQFPIISEGVSKW